VGLGPSTHRGMGEALVVVPSGHNNIWLITGTPTRQHLAMPRSRATHCRQGGHAQHPKKAKVEDATRETPETQEFYKSPAALPHAI